VTIIESFSFFLRFLPPYFYFYAEGLGLRIRLDHFSK
jgi:hypothetical protein